MSDVTIASGLYDWLLFGHIVAAMVWVGGSVVLGATAVQVARDGEPAAVARFVGQMRVIGPRILAPSTIAVLGFGVWMVLDSAAWDFGQLWVVLALGLFAAAFVSAPPTRAGRRSARSARSSTRTTTRCAASLLAGLGVTG